MKRTFWRYSRNLADSPGPQQGREMCPGFALLSRGCGPCGRQGAGICWEHTFLVSAGPGASWEGQSRAGLDLAQGRALLPRLFRSNPFSWHWHRRAPAHAALSAQPFLSSLPPFTPIFFSLYCYQCPQGVGHEICADWCDPEGNFSASR